MFKTLSVLVAGATLALLTAAEARQAQASPIQTQIQGQTQNSAQDRDQAQGQGSGGQHMRGAGGFPGGGRGILGTVTQTAADHYTIKTDAGESFTVYYSVNTRILKQGPSQAGRGQAGGQSGGQSGNQSGNQSRRAPAAGQDSDNDVSGGTDRERSQPQPLKSTDIKVGDIITAGGEVDDAKKSIGAVFIAQIDPERAKQIREREASYGKTWLAGRITAIDGTRITVDGMVDHTTHVVEVDENTSFRRRRESITMADIQPGQMLQAEGAVKAGVFLATTVTAQQPRDPTHDSGRDGGRGGANPGSSGGNSPLSPPQ